MKNNSQLKLQKIIYIHSIICFILLFQGCKKEDELSHPNLIKSWEISEEGSTAPWGLTIDNQLNVYTSELFGSRISKFTSSGTLVTRWGTLGAGNSQFNWPKHIAVDDNSNIYVADEANDRIQKFTSSGDYITQWGNPVPISGQLAWRAATISVDIENNWVYTIDMYNRIQKFDLSGNFITQWGGTGTGDGQLMLYNGDLNNQGPNGQMIVDKTGNIYVVDNMNHRIQKFSSSGDFLMKWGTKGSGFGQFLFPCGIAIDNVNGFIYVSDNSLIEGSSNNIARIQKFDLSGNFIKQIICVKQPGNQNVGALAVDNSGFVLSIEGRKVIIYDFNK